jgi:hypothetical protein
MPSRFQQRLLQLMCSAYGLMLRAYPLDFRGEYGREMMLVFTTQARDIIRKNGVFALLPFAHHIVWDWLTTIFDETGSMRKILTLGAASFLFLAVDWLAFHDIREPHTFRDYLTLLASFLVFLSFGLELLGKVNVTSRLSE